MSERDDITEQAYHEPVIIGQKHAATYHPLPTGGVGTPARLSVALFETSKALDWMLKLQLEVEEAWGRNVDADDPEAVSAYIRDVVLCATDELHEVLGEVHWKPWKDSRGIKDRDKYREEMADVLHFVLDLYLAGGLTGKDMITDYLTKHYENLERRQSAAYRQS